MEFYLDLMHIHYAFKYGNIEAVKAFMIAKNIADSVQVFDRDISCRLSQ